MSTQRFFSSHDHSLSQAVADGTVSGTAALCGLSPDDMTRLARVHGAALVLVRLRSATADERVIISASDFASFADLGRLRACGREWSHADVRDVCAIASAVDPSLVVMGCPSDLTPHTWHECHGKGDADHFALMLDDSENAVERATGIAPIWMSRN